MFACKQKQILISPLEQFTSVNQDLTKSGKFISKSVVFVVENYRNNTHSKMAIDSFINNYKPIDIKDYYLYTVDFYKYSDETNAQHLKENPRDLSRYGQENDWIYSYIFIKGKLVDRYTVENGNFIEPENKAKIENFP